MAGIHVFTNGMAIVNGTDLSDHVQSITTTDNRAQVDVTAMGATGKAYQKGLGDATIEITFYQDSTAGKVHATLSPLISSTTPVTVEVRETNAARSATNITCLLSSALLFTYSGLDGSVTGNNALMVKATFQNASSSGGMTYPTS